MYLLRLDPGELFISTEPTEVHTLLGSCVSIVFFHPRLRQGAICHGKRPSRECSRHGCGLKICRQLGDYVSCSLEFMLAYFDQKGVPRQELEVKLFGGALMFNSPGISMDAPMLSMGQRNIDTAMEFIRSRRLHLTASDIGGPWARQIQFFTDSGEIRLKRIRKSPLELMALENGKSTC
ncbi:MAG: chemotaxis protein CheD [Magnetococcales bacterium]|nr:chemotaxis protein CheD [Magnetococcales bacterium]